MTGSERTGVGATLQDFWEHRPVRPRHGGKLGGVSAALGHRYGIDPVLIRVAFVVATFYGGAGATLYLLGWLLLPKEGEAGPDGQPRTEQTSGAKAVVLVVLLIVSMSAVVRGPGLFGLAVGLFALYLMHHHYRDHTPVQTPDKDTEMSTVDQEGGQQQPPRWDPLGAAPLAWDLPEPSEQPAKPEPSRRPVITLVTLALALLAGGLSLATGTALSTALAVALGVLGAGMIAGSFLHGGRGLIAAAIPVGALAALFSIIPISPWHGIADHREHPMTIQAVQPRYQVSAGNIELDLRDLRIASGQEVTTRADVGAGNISVHLPPDADVDVRCAADLGSVQCLDDQRDGRHARAEVHDLGTNGPGGGHLVLDLKAGTGNVEVFRD